MSSSQLSLETLEGWRTKASALASLDRMGIVIARSFDLMSTVARDGVGAESVSDQIALLEQDRAFVSRRDNSAATPLRELIYALIENFGLLVEDIAMKKTEEKMGQIMNEEPANLPAVGLCSGVKVDGQAVLDAVVKEEEPMFIDVSAFAKTSSSKSAKALSTRSEGGGEAGVSSSTSATEPPTVILTMVKDVLRTPASSAPARKRPRVAEREVADQKQPEASAGSSYRCDTCSEEYETAAGLATHQVTQNHLPARATPQPDDGVGAHPCPYCDLTFQFRSRLKDHICMHTGERPYKCTECSAGYISRAQLNSHQRNAHNIAPYSCPCGSQFERRLELVKHRNVCSAPMGGTIP
ncbi:hypothetical protein PMAYCL1PPCAC_04399 [Pristionchus mayeri]|uniref:C2H2-type domain-containing protein n=1 Tax=Pristionchus mayeri TaxID=1317129 RepID=A0AAN5C9T7_9BILA|nr:hypothetical protein PMAYCL1PPCAC_04399 [Pristionchus mayeri]